MDTTTNEPGKSINYRTDQLSPGVWKGQIVGLVVNYPELELRITQTEPSIKGMWRQVMIGAGPDVPVVDTLRGEIIGKNDTGKILLILKTSFHDSAYYLKYLSGKCFTRDLGLHNELHKHTFFGIAESEQTLKYGYPGSFFEFRKEDWTEQRKK
ncbi:MAG: hypothetical protein Q8916_13580 [Bacteroidota bacterium]|nr:hypothetical protein [Bacteroidota bacterium]MDP4231424.1 hypothetical protein [Bacteroidota bacterium]